MPPSSPIPYIVVAFVIGCLIFSLLVLCALWAGGKSDERPEDGSFIDNYAIPINDGISLEQDWFAGDEPTWEW